MGFLRRLSIAKLLVAVVLGSFVGTLVGVGYVSTPSNAALKSVSAVSGLQSASSVSITGGTIAGVSGVPDVLNATGLYFVTAPTGTMANNGAVTLGTALDRTYSEGLWMFLPAGAVAAGVPASASWLWAVMSSATVGVVYNSTYTTGVPTAGTTTAFVTTGPGAFAGDTSEQGITIPVAANLMGLGGLIDSEVLVKVNNSAGTKTARIRFSGSSGTIYASVAGTTVTYLLAKARFANNGIATAQDGLSETYSSAGFIGSSLASSTVDTTGATTVYISVMKGAATDYAIIALSRVRLERFS